MGTYVISGANRGIGLELCRQLQARGDGVIALCRAPSSDLQALDVRVEAGVDVTDDAAVSALAERLADVDIDVLINNAGVLRRDGVEALDFDRIRQQFEVNALGPLRLTAALRGRIRRGGKVGIISSRMGSLRDNTSGGAYGYRMSKAAVNAAGVSLARDLAAAEIAVALLHPGYVRTDMTGGHGHIDPPEAAAGLLARLDALDLESSGGFWHSNGERLPW
jgi:NAD(P)-dependent dehydrogenase (short-subunit alcohol dehydrogenase family)